MNTKHFCPWIRDGVDVYLARDGILHFVFLATRKRIQVNVHRDLVDTLEWFDGTQTVENLESRFQRIKTRPIFLTPFVEYLHSKGIVVEKNWMTRFISETDSRRFSRQLNFFLDLEGSAERACRLFKRILGLRVAIFGLGAVGSWITTELMQMGCKYFVLVDPNRLSSSDVSRHAFFSTEGIGVPKVDVAAKHIWVHSPDAKCYPIKEWLGFDTDIAKMAGDCDLMINTADEPYIGATSVKLSRYCVKESKPLLVAGGFDAHLGSLGELIVPGKTPCADCYAGYFSKSLKDWRPERHPVWDRRTGSGGLVLLSAFSASCATTKILRFLIDHEDVDHGRGELLYTEYSVEKFNVDRDPECPVCSHLN